MRFDCFQKNHCSHPYRFLFTFNKKTLTLLSGFLPKPCNLLNMEMLLDVLSYHFTIEQVHNTVRIVRIIR